MVYLAPKILAAEHREFTQNFLNADIVMSDAMNAFPIHQINQPTKGWFMLFFMQIANGKDPHALWETYNNAHVTFREMLDAGFDKTKAKLNEYPDPDSPPNVLKAFNEEYDNARKIMKMFEQIASVFRDETSYEDMYESMSWHLKKLAPRHECKNGQLIPFRDPNTLEPDELDYVA